MRLYLQLSALILLLCTTSEALLDQMQSASTVQKKPVDASSVHALVIGIKKYKFSQDFTPAVNNTIDIANALKFSNAATVKILIDKQATRDAIFSAWMELRKQAKPGDTLILTYSGHTQQDETILLSEYDRNSINSRSRIDNNEIRQMVEDAEDFNIIMVFDANYSSGLVLGNSSFSESDNEVTELKTDSTYRIFLTVTTSNQSIWELVIDGTRRTALSYYFARAIRGHADTNNDDRTSLIELKDYIEKNTREESAGIQTPFVSFPASLSHQTLFTPLSIQPQQSPIHYDNDNQKKIAQNHTKYKPVDASNIYALVVGIEEYKNGRKVDGALNDANYIARTLHRANAAKVVVLLDQSATKANVMTEWKNLQKNASPGDTLLFTYSGTGGQLTTGTEDDGYDAVIALYDWIEVKKNIIMGDELYQMTLEAKEFNIVMVFDSPYSGGLMDFSNTQTSLGKERISDNHIITLSASSESQSSFTFNINGSQHGALSYYFAMALNGYADKNNDGELSALELGSYVNKNVRERSNYRQTPSFTYTESLADQSLFVSTIRSTPQRYALLIGNSKYRELDHLKTSQNDAKDLGVVLSKYGFEVNIWTDADTSTTRQALKTFYESIVDAELTIVYFSGYAVQANRDNYLLPTDIRARTRSVRQLRVEAVSVRDIIIKLERTNVGYGLIILDASRKSPSLNMQKEVQGLYNTVSASDNIVIASAAQPHSIALGSEVNAINSLYTSSLITHLIAFPHAKLSDVFRNVYIDVYTRSNKVQKPWESTRIISDLCFNDCKPSDELNSYLR